MSMFGVDMKLLEEIVTKYDRIRSDYFTSMNPTIIVHLASIKNIINNRLSLYLPTCFEN